MSFFNQRGIFLQLLAPSITNPREAQVSMQLARKELGWEAVNEVQTEALVDSVYVTAVSSDGGQSFTIKTINSDVDGDGDIDGNDKAKLLALAKAYSSIVNP
ncbi:MULTISPECIES: hypothetical protein [Pseudomonas]|jgi:hypothetical protein|uniref:Uncharacterized protein n=2 Tax=Pseudomonas TaxID=286 RepID=A0ACC5MLN2_9PSED|nr:MULTISPECIES: hypothetical protein [Pseudomonas]ATE80379.1 hypothetical protein CNN82_29720 [Pseudomonas frederiksbergensis]MBB2889767.1 hypothetical protein [Pseudomonas umsongensis]NMN79232.1 hypothetical protein [Pseudomonas sp. KD5]CAH0322252.1 hypothetical protein SRABI123_05599 [Pseudomonas sp. Bi123]GID08791.1 hypothetical protein TMM008_59930 [Pseudomonas sp. 008]